MTFLKIKKKKERKKERRRRRGKNNQIWINNYANNIITQIRERQRKIEREEREGELCLSVVHKWYGITCGCGKCVHNYTAKMTKVQLNLQVYLMKSWTLANIFSCTCCWRLEFPRTKVSVLYGFYGGRCCACADISISRALKYIKNKQKPKMLSNFIRMADMHAGFVVKWRFLRVPAGSPSRGGDFAVYVFEINQPSLPTPFYSVLVSISVFIALSIVFHSKNSPDNSSFSHSVLPALFLPYRSFQLGISLRKSPSALI